MGESGHKHLIHCSDKGNGMIKQGYLMEYNWEREISPYAAVKEGLSKKVTEASGQRAHGHKQESS